VKHERISSRFSAYHAIAYPIYPLQYLGYRTPPWYFSPVDPLNSRTPSPISIELSRRIRKGPTVVSTHHYHHYHHLSHPYLIPYLTYPLVPDLPPHPRYSKEPASQYFPPLRYCTRHTRSLYGSRHPACQTRVSGHGKAEILEWNVFWRVGT